jgi:chaperone modulatory protein CbpM
MSNQDLQVARGAIVEEEVHLTLVELCQACCAPEEHVIAWVFEGVLQPLGERPQEWRFTGQSLRRARLALWLTRDLEINPPGVALALDLLEELDALRAQLQRLGVR